jgi:integrase
MSDKITPVKLDSNGLVIAPDAKTRVAKWRVTIGKKITGDKKQRRFFSTEKEAKDWIEEKMVERKKKGEDAFGITDKLRLEAMECQKRLKEADADVSLTKAVDYYLLHAMPAGGKKTFSEVAEKFLISREKIGCKPKTMTQYRSYIKVINKEWAEEYIHEISQEDLEDWLAESEWAPRTRKNYIVTLTTMMGFAITRKYRVDNPAAQVERPILDDKPPGILTPAQAGMLFDAAKECMPEMITPIAIGLFAGLRRSEICALDWSEIDLDERHIEIKGTKAKTRQRRLVSISDNLLAWLQAYSQDSGPVAPNVDLFGEKLKHLVHGRPKTDDDPGRPAIVAEWPHNALRHSFGSYLYGKCKNENLTAAEMGNSPAMVFKHYRALVKPPQVEAYWKIMPDSKPAVIIPFKAAAAK